MTAHDSNSNGKLIAPNKPEIDEASSTLTDQDEYHLVRRSRGGKPYIRRKPFTYRKPTEEQRRMRDEFGKLAREHGKGKRGLTTIEKGGTVKDIPKSAEPLMGLKGKRTKAPEPTGDTTTPPEE